MVEAGTPHEDKPDSHDLDQEARVENYAALAYGLNVVSLFATAYIVNMAVSSVREHRAENFAELALCVLGIPLFIVQVIVFLPLIFFCDHKLALFGSNIHSRWRRYSAVLIPSVTLTAIVIGIALTEWHHRK